MMNDKAIEKKQRIYELLEEAEKNGDMERQIELMESLVAINNESKTGDDNESDA